MPPFPDVNQVAPDLKVTATPRCLYSSFSIPLPLYLLRILILIPYRDPADDLSELQRYLIWANPSLQKMPGLCLTSSDSLLNGDDMITEEHINYTL